MPLIDDARRWLKDRLGQDEYIDGTPKQHIARIDEALAHLNTAERLRQLDHIRAYSDYYYQGRHKESVPGDVRQQLRTLENRIERLNAVDQARDILQKMGGPPSRQTIADSLDRSMRQRIDERRSIRQEPDAPRESLGIRMHI